MPEAKTEVRCPTPLHNVCQGKCGLPRFTSITMDSRDRSPKERLRSDGIHNQDPNEREAPADLDNVTHRPIQVGAAQAKSAQWNSSSTIGLVEEAFHHHHASSPQDSATSAFSASQWMHPRTLNTDTKRRIGYQDPVQRVLSRHARSNTKPMAERSIPSSAERELLSLLPSHDAALLLVNNYFDRIHWFMLLFHQRDFGDSFERIYSPNREQCPPKGASSQIGYIAVLLAVCATSLQYTTASQRHTLASEGVEADALKDRILTTLRLRLLDVLSLGSLEAVHMCVLLGSYYLYHGQPELAWPLCGCGLRIAQALNLHRKVPLDCSNQEGHNQPKISARQRCWWAVYEIETFCSMMHGFPLSISDSDCDIEELDPHDDCSASATQNQSPDQPTLLFFKCAMSRLSKIVKCALTELYGTHRDLDKQNRPIVGDVSRLQSLIEKVAGLEMRILQWQESLPTKLRLEHDACFTEQLFQLQALVLKLAFENARILIHRPLLSYKLVAVKGAHKDDSGTRLDPFQRSIRACREAALQVSRVGSAPIFRHISDTYATTFASVHLFTAGVTLCIMTSLDPLSRESHESKLGIHGLIEMQTILQPQSIAAAQGLEILRNLMSLVMAKEINSIFEVRPPAMVDKQQISGDPPTSTTSSSEVQLQRHTVLPEGDHEPTRVASDSLMGNVEFSFCENPSMTEALLDFEQVISYPPSDVADEDPPSLTEDYLSRNYFVGQDQAWIWGWHGNI
ncbi:fungal specific transcription factor domain-containing protein [Trichoderma breve]|uniref:Fungal specific transcription factor domain-containing protein n=1 Tax=Trichoderma breve TaxID=2034170 RepID=A0A9W9E402_9HYPO|nr:fungal specific transcription factor domain-containing protein [Trichoderma breve]KAJ4857299.1 fungal specific transcription factor domain-containing protein [Trichoderma breve]